MNDLEIRTIKNLLSTPPFKVEELTVYDTVASSQLDHKYYRINAPDWVNIVATTPSGEFLLVKQPRFGANQRTIEIPGGGIDHGEDPVMAAARELEEETGYRSQNITLVGHISPNPAIMSNRLFICYAKDCVYPEVRKHYPDGMERIEVLLASPSNLSSMIDEGRFENALGLLAVLLTSKKGLISIS